MIADSDPMLLRIMESLGALRADMQNMKDDQEIERRTGAEFRREVRLEIRTVQDNITDIKHTIKPVAETVQQHATTLQDHSDKIKGFKLFQDKIGAAIALGTTVVGMVVGGVYWLITTYWAELIAAIRGFFTRS
ncbi:hypothetical protein [Ancylobacter polymorphus]|uniref:DUF1515 domain-containing protein n=1 Tax=Ancylobacter polymorphus TaxID=223390 RepID=A0ABU0B6A0_9HYPH|nr:hypothetical protein [Ancylobacter polymorphus]MDQ0301340.1 hypothetical protein [Ancylobacter polymorphus]